MAGRNRNAQDETIATIATLAAGAAVGYGCYKVFKSIFSSEDTQQNRPISSSQSQPSRSSSFGSMLQSAAVAYHSAQNSDNLSIQPNDDDDYETHPQLVPFQRNSPYSFPKESKIYVVNTIEECRYAMRELKSHCDLYNVLGFDCEWVNKSQWEGGRQKVALLQFATHRGLCVVIRLCKLRYIPSELKNILMDRNIIKVGISPSNDAQYLCQDYFEWGDARDHIAGTLDLRYVANVAKCYDGNISLAKMANRYLNVILDKDISVRCSDWDASNLDNAQIQYAAKDAIIAIELFKHFAEIIEPTSLFGSNLSRLETILRKFSTLFDQEYDEDWEYK
ncbi:exonuclease 3'-5' domain-containing protein 2-like [Contarinia nasturtii]|uniref:exonuclease 3'-5' domain-containing protein 2-like n=1 Tax=Contarinia nasturtii TaxID=265458 RepID=UPI0012D388C2|nr:exonuclease 3'-5' domain-containing protein 2-like [Contarinia nasturtii]